MDCHRQKEQQVPISRRGAYEYHPSAAHPSFPHPTEKMDSGKSIHREAKNLQYKSEHTQELPNISTQSTPETGHQTQ